MPKNTQSTSSAKALITSSSSSRSPRWLVPPAQPTRGRTLLWRLLVRPAHSGAASMFGTTRMSWCRLDSASARGWVDTTTRSHKAMP
ncbi:hypothetical protein D3C76_1558210 [compost metagenome]